MAPVVSVAKASLKGDSLCDAYFSKDKDVSKKKLRGFLFLSVVL